MEKLGVITVFTNKYSPNKRITFQEKTFVAINVKPIGNSVKRFISFANHKARLSFLRLAASPENTCPRRLSVWTKPWKFRNWSGWIKNVLEKVSRKTELKLSYFRNKNLSTKYPAQTLLLKYISRWSSATTNVCNLNYK